MPRLAQPLPTRHRYLLASHSIVDVHMAHMAAEPYTERWRTASSQIASSIRAHTMAVAHTTPMQFDASISDATRRHRMRMAAAHTMVRFGTATSADAVLTTAAVSPTGLSTTATSITTVRSIAGPAVIMELSTAAQFPATPPLTTTTARAVALITEHSTSASSLTIWHIS